MALSDDDAEVGVDLTQALAGTRVVSSGLRSTNIERDSDTGDIGAIYLGSHAIDILGRLTAAIEDPARTRAWSLTGPYGSGKSTIALLISALVGPSGTRRDLASTALRESNPELAARLAIARDDLGADGFVIATATARPEPLRETLIRALIRGVNRRWPDGKPTRRVARSLRSLRQTDAGTVEVLDTVQTLCAEGPVLLIVDEFGKTLEYLASQSEDERVADDMFILQEVAEMGAGMSGLPLYTFTLQHQSFLDYAARSSSLQRREWAKVQGRFEDLTFTPDVTDAVQLVKSFVSHDLLEDVDRRLVRRYADAVTQMWTSLGLQGVLQVDADLFSGLYPLHPLTSVVAPLIAAQVGQNDRSLAGFLTSDEPHTVRRFLAMRGDQGVGRGVTVDLPQLYDYFFASGRSTMLASANAGRWIEIDLILSQSHGLGERELQVLKTVGLLNLIDSLGAMRASLDMVSFALDDLTSLERNDVVRKEVQTCLDRLVDRGFLVYRDFSDEYRIWRGTDFDIQARLGAARERWDEHAVVKMLASHLPPAVVAGRHSQQTGMLRHFTTTVSDRSTDTVTGPAVRDAADGLLILHFGTQRDIPEVRSNLPAVVGISRNAQTVLDIGRELMALNELLFEDDIDAVARREISERAGHARGELSSAVASAFNPTGEETEWFLVGPPRPGDPEEALSGRAEIRLAGRSLAGIVSSACDKVYSDSPHIRNEMLGRHQLTSQGAKARRELITAMLTHSDERYLGINGYGPERAIYDGVLAYLGLHGPALHPAESGAELLSYKFEEPRASSSLMPAWQALRGALTSAAKECSVQSLFDVLMAPPYGVKAGVAPVMVVAALIMSKDEVAIFEEGSYQPNFSADLAERLIKAPERYSIKYVPAGEGQRRLVLEQISVRLGFKALRQPSSPIRNLALLSVTRELLGVVRSLTSYASRTQRVSSRAAAVRRTLTTARDPDDLIFTALPLALDLEPIHVGAEPDPEAAEIYVSRLAEVMREIIGADEALESDVISILARELHLPSELSELRRTLSARTAGLRESVEDPELRGFLALATNDALAEDEWLDPVAVRIVRTGLANWTDSHIRQFEETVRRMAKALDRVSYLYAFDGREVIDDESAARLITVTLPNGHEDRVLARLPRSLEDLAARFAAEVAEEADRQLGADGRRALLASLARLISNPEEAGQ